MNADPRPDLEVLTSRLERLEAEVTAARAFRRRVLLVAAVLVLGAVPFAARDAWAATCTPTGAFLYLPALKYFCADTVALASDVNANTQGIISSVEAKIGPLNSPTIAAGMTRGVNFDGCYVASCPAGSSPLFANVSCPTGVRVGNSRVSGGTSWYADCGTTANCATFIDLWCSTVLK